MSLQIACVRYVLDFVRQNSLFGCTRKGTRIACPRVGETVRGLRGRRTDA